VRTRKRLTTNEHEWTPIKAERTTDLKFALSQVAHFYRRDFTLHVADPFSSIHGSRGCQGCGPLFPTDTDLLNQEKRSRGNGKDLLRSWFPYQNLIRVHSCQFVVGKTKCQALGEKEPA
jgi:hypothetical protein